MTEPANSVAPTLVRESGISYLFMPTTDPEASADFYESVFGWTIRGRGGNHVSFDDGTGHVSGAWTTDQEIAREPGMMLYIYVHHIDDTVALIEKHGGQIIKPVYSEGSLWVCSFRDPAGNLLGVWHHGSR